MKGTRAWIPATAGTDVVKAAWSAMGDSTMFSGEFAPGHYVFGEKAILHTFIKGLLDLDPKERAADIDGTYKLGRGNWALVVLSARTTRWAERTKDWVHSHVTGLTMYSKGERGSSIKAMFEWLKAVAIAVFEEELDIRVFAMDCWGGARSAITEAFPQATVVTDTVHMLRSVREKKGLLVGDDKKQELAQMEQLVCRFIEPTSERQFLVLAAVIRQEMEVGMRQGGVHVVIYMGNIFNIGHVRYI
jgi:hypothetical protein